MRVLIAEDDEFLARTIAAGLRREGMAVDIALDGNAALEHAAVNRYDVVVLTGTCPARTAMTSAGPSPRADPRAGC